jgi:hypothetical protein
MRGELDDRLGHVVVVQHHVLAVDLRHIIESTYCITPDTVKIAPCNTAATVLRLMCAVCCVRLCACRSSGMGGRSPSSAGPSAACTRRRPPPHLHAHASRRRRQRHGKEADEEPLFTSCHGDEG